MGQGQDAVATPRMRNLHGDVRFVDRGASVQARQVRDVPDTEGLIHLTEHLMSNDDSASPLAHPTYACTPLAARLGMGLVAVLASGTILGGLLGLFEMRGADAALAQAAKSAPRSSSGLAACELRIGSRG